MVRVGLFWFLLAALVTVSAARLSAAPRPGADPVVIGIDAEFGLMASNAAEIVYSGVTLAVEEINQAGGVLNGRPLKVEVRDNRSFPDRARRNLTELASIENLVAVVGGKSSPVAQELVPLVHQLGLIYLVPLASADSIVDNGHMPNYVFRLSLRDSWALRVLIEHVHRRNWTRLGLLLPNNQWGRSVLEAATRYRPASGIRPMMHVEWYNIGESSFAAQYTEFHAQGSEAILLVANERDAAILVREVAQLPPARRLPILSHFGIGSENFLTLAGEALSQVELSLILPFRLSEAASQADAHFIAQVRQRFGEDALSKLGSPGGIANSYDLTRLLARAIDQAGSTDRVAIRSALEQITGFTPVTRSEEPPFTASRHEAMRPDSLMMARILADGTLEPLPAAAPNPAGSRPVITPP